MREAEAFRQRPSDGAFAARRGTIDGNDDGTDVRCASSCARFDRGISLWQGAPPNAARPRPARQKSKWETIMVKPEWGAKRTCPKCSTRFYDLGNDNPVHCIECGTDFVPEPVLKSKQPMAFEAAPVAAKEPARTTSSLRKIWPSMRTRKSVPTRKSISKQATTTLASKRRGRRRELNDKVREIRRIFPLFQRGIIRLRARGRGAVAQLGERRNGIAKVRGSIPLGSTTHPKVKAKASAPGSRNSIVKVRSRTSPFWRTS